MEIVVVINVLVVYEGTTRQLVQLLACILELVVLVVRVRVLAVVIVVCALRHAARAFQLLEDRAPFDAALAVVFSSLLRWRLVD